VALSGVLLAGGGLFARKPGDFGHANLGVGTSHVLQFLVGAGFKGHTNPQKLGFAGPARRGNTTAPGGAPVRVVTAESFSLDDYVSNFTPEDYRPGDDTDAMYVYIGPNYFSTISIPLISGREFTEADTAASPTVCIINEKLAQRSFPGRNPIGLHITHGGGKL